MSNVKKRKILVTSALPYANGDIHLGHLVEYLQTDFWVRFQKLRGNECRYFCADDTHGTPIMVSAKKQGIKPEDLVANTQKRHLQDFTDFDIEFDNYSSTNSKTNRELCNFIYLKMEENKLITTKKIKQSYCEQDKMFLPDRFVLGDCPKCGAKDQYGDSCDECSATYSTTDLKNARCAHCGSKPIEKESEHLFFELNQFKDFLKEWVVNHVQKDMVKKLLEWFDEDLRSWDISRDAPYFGFEIPNHKNKYFYVWVDAPIGYIATSKDWCDTSHRNYEEFWLDSVNNNTNIENDTEIYHFIGKDIVYFHSLFWPAMLKNAGYKTPDKIFIHGFLKVNGEKMSKSKGTFIKARTYLDELDASYLRFYYAGKMSATVDDIDLSFDDFIQRVNSDLVGKITNLASRGAQMLNKKFDSQMQNTSTEGRKLIEKAINTQEVIAKHYEDRNFSKVIVEIRKIADEANRYFDEKKPWVSIKENPKKTQEVLVDILNLFRIMAIYLKPILPSYVQKVEKLFNEESFNWNSINQIIENKSISNYEHLTTRVDSKSIDKIIENSKQSLDTKESKKNSSKNVSSNKNPNNKEENSDLIEFNDFMKIDLRVAEVLDAQDIKEADKLLKLKVSLGDSQRQIIAGIKKFYSPQDLIGKKIVIIANLKPRKMKFGISEGMLLAASDEPKVIFAPKNSKAGDKIK